MHLTQSALQEELRRLEKGWLTAQRKKGKAVHVRAQSIVSVQPDLQAPVKRTLRKTGISWAKAMDQAREVLAAAYRHKDPGSVVAASVGLNRRSLQAMQDALNPAIARRAKTMEPGPGRRRKLGPDGPGHDLPDIPGSDDSPGTPGQDPNVLTLNPEFPFLLRNLPSPPSDPSSDVTFQVAAGADGSFSILAKRVAAPVIAGNISGAIGAYIEAPRFSQRLEVRAFFDYDADLWATALGGWCSTGAYIELSLMHGSRVIASNETPLLVIHAPLLWVWHDRSSGRSQSIYLSLPADGRIQGGELLTVCLTARVGYGGGAVYVESYGLLKGLLRSIRVNWK